MIYLYLEIYLCVILLYWYLDIITFIRDAFQVVYVMMLLQSTTSAMLFDGVAFAFAFAR